MNHPHPKQRSRGRGNGSGGGGGGKPKHHINVRSQVFDSNGPEGRIRGSAHQVMEKYLAMARDASSQGDRVAAENYYQHAEHYFRLVNAYAQSNGQRRPQNTPTPAEDQSEAMEGDDEQGASSSEENQSAAAEASDAPAAESEAVNA